MNFLDHTLPETTQHYLDALAHISSKQAQQNYLMEKVKAHNVFLASQIAALTTHSVEQVNLVKNRQTQIDALLQRVTSLEGNLAHMAQAQEAARSAVQATAAKTVASTQAVKGADIVSQTEAYLASLKARLVAELEKDTGKKPAPKTETLMAGRYRDNGDGTVTDITTGLQWMRFALGQEWDAGKCVGVVPKYTWNEAKSAVNKLNRGTGYADCSDWRLPSKEELLSLVYCSSGEPKTWNDTGKECEGAYESPTIFQPAFPNTGNSYFWSGSLVANGSGRAWRIYFGNGSAHDGDRSYAYRVRLVRSR